LPTLQSSIPKAQSPSSQSSVVPEGSILVTINGISGDNSYAPNPIIINSGETITWYNADTVSHTVTSGLDSDPDEGQLFDSDAILSKQAFTLKFDNGGTFNYYCIYHPSMVGEIVVK
jgi:aldose sugar dehydrogenase